MTLESSSGQLEGFMYCMNDISHFAYPCERYLESCCRTLRAYSELSGVVCEIKIDVLEASVLESHGVY